MVVWTEPAKIDLQHIYEFIAEDSKRYARIVAKELVEKTDLVRKSPQIGKIVPEINNENVRELHLYSYRILYEINHPNIVILAVIHKRRDFKPDDIVKNDV